MAKMPQVGSTQIDLLGNSPNDSIWQYITILHAEFFGLQLGYMATRESKVFSKEDDLPGLPVLKIPWLPYPQTEVLQPKYSRTMS